MSPRPGKRISDIEVTDVSRHGFWLLIQDRELFVPFEEFPWFRDAPIGKLLNVELAHSHHLYWPDLDVDLAVESIERPEHFPLISKAVIGAPKRNVRSSKDRKKVKKSREGT